MGRVHKRKGISVSIVENRIARQRALDILREHAETGLTKNQLREALEVNPGVYRRLIDSMISRGEITITEEDVPHWGPTKFIRAAA